MYSLLATSSPRNLVALYDLLGEMGKEESSMVCGLVSLGLTDGWLSVEFYFKEVYAVSLPLLFAVLGRSSLPLNAGMRYS